jgi:hypothetical protein
MTRNVGFLAYATANEGCGHLWDVANVRRWLRWNSGVERIDVCFAISEVHPRRKHEERFYRKLADRLESSGKFRVIDIVFKSNVGRDFSSWLACIKRFQPIAQPDDFVLMLNRSAYGPYLADWYRSYTVAFVHHPDLGVCGSSINFEFKTHVQTYAWMTRMGIISELAENFPGGTARSSTEAIFKGELGLSQELMARGYRITSLAWPDEIFDAQRMHEGRFPQYNISIRPGSVGIRDVPFRHWVNGDRAWARFDPRARLIWLGSRLAI